MPFKLLKKAAAIFTAITFLSTNSIYAGPASKSVFKNKKVNYQKISDKNEGAIQKKKAVLRGEDASQSESQKKEERKILSSHLSEISLIHIPEELGRVVEAYQDPNHDNSKLVVHIQDLHTNSEASLNLAKILEILLKDYNLGLVCSEGADGAVDTSSVSSFPDAKVREKVAKLFVDSGELTGEEYLSITKYPKLLIWGIENKEIYFKNIAEFNSIMKFNPDSQVFISQTKKALEELKPKIYSKELLAIDQKESDYANQKVNTTDYLKFLSSCIQKLNIPTASYKNIALLNETINQESRIDQQKIMQESQNLLLNLQSAVAAKSSRSDMDTLMAKASLFKDQKISPFSFYSYLKDLANKHLKDQLSKYPNLTEFTDYLVKVNSLDSMKLFIEMEDLAYEIKQRLARNDEEKRFTQASRNIKFLEGFFNLKISNEELDYYLQNKDSHKVAFFEGFLKPELQKYSISSFVDFNPGLIDTHFQELEDFYKTAKSRDIVMFNNSVSEIEKRNIKVSALVAGGFHTRGITQLLKDKGYSYIVISPYSKTEIDEENYHFLLSGKRKPIEELIKDLDKPFADKASQVSANLRVPMAFDEDSANQTADRMADVIPRESKGRNGTPTGGLKEQPVIQEQQLPRRGSSGSKLASNTELELACKDARISPETLSEIIAAYSSIYEGSRKAEGINLSAERIGIDKIRSVLQDIILTEQEKLLVLRYIVFGKGSIFTFWNELDETGKKRLITQMEMLDLDSIEKLYKTFILENKPGAEVKITDSNLAMPSIIDVSDVSLPAYEQAMKEGENAFREGRVCFLELAGGSGSRLGYAHAKIMLQASQVMSMSLGRMRAKKIRAVAEKYGKPVPWLIMTSDVTDFEIRKFFEDNIENDQYFGEVPVKWVRFIRQQVMPQVTARGEFVLSDTKHNIVVGGYGHGDARDYVLRDARVQEWLKSFGSRYIVALNVDNAYMPSALSVGYHIITTRNLPLGTERMSVHSVEKNNPEEKVGMNVLIRDPKDTVNGDLRSAVIEYNQIPDNLLYVTYEYILDGKKIVFLKNNGKFTILMQEELQKKYRGSFENTVWVRENLTDLQTVLAGLKEGERIKHFAIEYDKETLSRAKLWLLLGNTNCLMWTLDPFLDKEHPLQDVPVLVARNKKVSGYHPESGKYHTQEDGGLKTDKFECMAFHGFFNNPVMGAFLLVPRGGYFAPIKDAEGKSADTLSQAKQIFIEYESKLLEQQRNWTVKSAAVELSPAFSFLDGTDLKEHVGEYGFVGDRAKLYLSGKNTHIGDRFNVKNDAVFILRVNEEYNEKSIAKIGNDVEVDGNISFEINGSGQLIIEDGVWLKGNRQYDIKSGEILHITREGERMENRSLASNGGIIPGRVELKKGSYDTKWWEEATMAELAKDPAPWGDDPIVPVEKDKGVLKVTLTAKMFEKWSPANPEGRDLDVSSNKYDEIGPLAIAGIRHVMNISNVHDTRQVKNSVERLLTSMALGLMIKIKYNKGANFPYLTNYGHEVRYHSEVFQDITTRTLAAMGFVANVVPGGVPTAIWNTSTMGKFFCMPLSFCGTSSHSPSSMDGLKIMDNEGSQFLISDIESLIAIKKAIVRHIKEKGSFTFTLAAESDPRITDQLYASTNNGMVVYKEYQERAAADKFILDFIRSLDPSKVHIDCAHGSGYRTLTVFFKEMGLQEVTDKIDWMHKEERPDFGNMGKLAEDPKTGKDKIYDLGADGTQMFEKIMPDGKAVKYFPVLCTADYPEVLSKMPIGDIILPTDMDNDRLYYMQILPNDTKTKALLDETGVVYNVLSNEKIVAVFIPNKSFHFLHEMNFERIASLMKDGKIDKNRTMVVLKTLASTPAVDKWAQERKKEGHKIEVINTAVGFAKLANVMYNAEGQMRKYPGEDVTIMDATGKSINIGSDPIILAAWEESGGIITGITYGFKDLLGNSFLAEREKSATESIFLSLALISKLQKEKGGVVNFAEYLKEIYDRDNIDTPIDFRYDNSLYVPSASKESALEEQTGNERKNRIFGAYLSIAIAKMQGKINMDGAKAILKDIFNQEYEARKAQGQLAPALIERYSKINFNFLKDVWFTGDGVMFVFENEGKQWFVLFRPSGTEPKLKSYGFGKEIDRLTTDAWAFGFNENTVGRLPGSFTDNAILMGLWGSDGLKAVDKGRRMQSAWEDFGLVIDPKDLDEQKLEELEKRKLVRNFRPPDNHLEMVNEWLKARGLPEVKVDLNSPQAMSQDTVLELLESIPEEVYNTLGHIKEEVLKKENAKLASNENVKRGAIIIAKKLEDAPLDARGNTAMAASFLKGGYGQEGYGVEQGAAIHGSFALRGNQGYYTQDAEGRETGKQAFLNSVNSMRKFFERRAERSGKPIKYVIKTGIGGQHTPFQGIADVFQVINAETGKVSGEYELGKDFEATMTSVLKDLNADWDQVAVIPSSKSGSTDETMMVFVEIFNTLLKHQAISEGIDGEKFARAVLNTLHDVNFINGGERAGKNLFKVDADRFGTGNLITLISNKVENLGVSRKQVEDIFAKVLGNMFFETTDRADQSRLSAFIRNSGLDKELGEDAPGFGAMFDNVGGRWTGDLHMMTFLAFHGLDAEKYWETARKNRVDVKEGRHIANTIGNKILDEGITDIALVVPDEFFWFGKSNEQNFNESIWQKGFANLVAVKESQWNAQKQNYANNPKRLVINMSNTEITSDLFNAVRLNTLNLNKIDNQALAGIFAELFTTFYGITTVVGDRLIARALAEAGYKPDDVDLNDLNNPATKIVQENLYVRQPYVEFGKGFLEKRLKALQEKESASPGAIEEEFNSIKQLAREGKIETSIEGLGITSNITNVEKLKEIIIEASEFAKKDNRKFVPFIYLEGDRFYNLRDYLTSLGIEWIMQGTGDQHISYQQVLAQPQKYLPFIISFVPEKTLPGKPAIGFAKGYLHNVSPHMVRDLFAEASYKALTESRKDQGGLGLFLRMTDSKGNIDMLAQAASVISNQKTAKIDNVPNTLMGLETGKNILSIADYISVPKEALHSDDMGSLQAAEIILAAQAQKRSVLSRKQQVDSMDQIVAVSADSVIADKKGFEAWIAQLPRNNAVVVIARSNDEYNGVREYENIAYIKMAGKDIDEAQTIKLTELFAVYGKNEFFKGFKLGTPYILDEYKSVIKEIALGI